MKPFISLLLAVSSFSLSAHAIFEDGYQLQYEMTIFPFLQSGERLNYKTTDGTNLVGVKYLQANSKGTILVLPGRSEPWLKYGEVFYDLFQKGYSIYSFDWRGQGLSPHLVSSNSQIGHIDRFEDYIEDLNGFVEEVLKKEVDSSSPLYLLAHSMGGVIAAGYLENYDSPFKAAALLAPMFQINTQPYSEPLALAIVSAYTRLGKSRQYAIGKGDYDPFLPFEKNDVTSSRVRFWMSNEVNARFSDTIIGGPSNEWIYRSLVASKRIANAISKVKTPILMFQAGADQIVKTDLQTLSCTRARQCELMTFPTSQHEILMEQDSIRDVAMEKIEAFLK